MFRSVCPLLLGLGLCVASGCASLGTGRGISMTERRPVAGVNPKTPANNDPRDPQGIVAFRPPKSNQHDTETEDQAFVGHSAVGLSAGSSGSKKTDGDRSSVVSAAYEAEPPSRLTRTDGENGEAIITAGVTDALYRSDRDGSDNPVQLQGLQVISPVDDVETPSRQPEVWSNRPVVAQSTMFGSDSRVTPASAQARPPGPWQDEVERLIARAELDLAGMPPNVDPAEYRRLQVHLRLLYLIARHPEQALTAIPTPDPADQEYWQQMLWAITNSLDSDELSVRERAAQTIPPVNLALRRLREQADLSIRNAAFCEEISYFGNYKRFAREECVPGQVVNLYAEIENFRSEPSTSGEYRTLLKSQIEIIDVNGRPRWGRSFPATEDVCRNPRRDYFHNYQFTIPERMPLGAYTLRLTVVDELSGKQATSLLKFMVK